MTWLSERSGMASIGVVKSAQYPQPPSNAKNAMTRNRFRSDSPISQLIMRRLQARGSWLEADFADAFPARAVHEGPSKPLLDYSRNRLDGPAGKGRGLEMEHELGAAVDHVAIIVNVQRTGGVREQAHVVARELHVQDYHVGASGDDEWRRLCADLPVLGNVDAGEIHDVLADFVRRTDR